MRICNRNAVTALFCLLSACGQGDPAQAPAGTQSEARIPGPITPTLPDPPQPDVPAVTAIKAKLKAHLANSPPGLAPQPTSVVAGAPGAPSAIANRRLVPFTSPLFRYVGRVEPVGGNFAGYGTNYAVDYGRFRASNTYFIEFMTDAQTFEILASGNGGASPHRVQIDGRYATLASVAYPADGANYLTRVTLPGPKAMHLIRIETYALYFGGINIGPDDILAAPPPADPVRAVILGDSYTEGTGTNQNYESFAGELGRLLDWRDLYCSGVGGTGYLARGSGFLNFRERARTDVYAFNPEVIVIAGGINDNGFPRAQLQAEASALYDEISARLPNAIVFVLANWDPRPGSTGVRDTLKAAVGNRQNFYFIDNIAEAWQTGTGSVARPTGDGNGDLYVSADNIHPSPAGHFYLGARLAADIRAIVSGF